LPRTGELFKLYLKRLVEDGYLGMVRGEYILTNDAYQFGTGKNMPSIDKAEGYTKENLIEMVVGTMYQAVGFKYFTTTRFKGIIAKFHKKRGFDDNWRKQIGDPKKIGGWLLDEGYLVYGGKTTTLKKKFRINDLKWSPTKEQGKERREEWWGD